MLYPWMPYSETDPYDRGWDRHNELFLGVHVYRPLRRHQPGRDDNSGCGDNRGPVCSAGVVSPMRRQRPFTGAVWPGPRTGNTTLPAGEGRLEDTGLHRERHACLGPDCVVDVRDQLVTRAVKWVRGFENIRIRCHIHHAR